MEPLIGTESEVAVAEKEWWRPENDLRLRRMRICDDAMALVGDSIIGF